MQKLIIAPYSQKKKLVKELGKQFVPFKIMTMEEVEDQFFFTYSKQAIYELCKKENIQYSIALMYLEQMKKLNYSSASSLKRKTLEVQKEYLDKLGLLEYNPYFKTYLKQTEIEVYGYNPLKREEQALIDCLRELTDVTVMDNKLHKQDILVYEAKTMEEEVLFVILEMIKHYKSGVPFSELQIIYDETYVTIVERLFKMFHIPLSRTASIPIYGTTIWKKIKTVFIESRTFEQANEKLVKLMETLTEVQQQMLQKIIQISNNYTLLPLDEITVSCIESEIKITSVPKPLNQKGVRFCSISEMTDGLCYLLGFNQGNYPHIEMNIDYFTDQEKQLLNYSTSAEVNTIMKERLKQVLYNNPNLVISYKKKTAFDSFYPSSLIADWGLEVKQITMDHLYSYSHLYNQLAYAEQKDEERKYNVKIPSLMYLKSTYPNLAYGTYDNQFTGINPLKLKNVWKDRMVLSYSHLDHFFRCGFRYYISHILKLELKEETFALLIGNLFHDVLSKAFFPDFNFEIAWNQFLKEKNLSKKDLFFLDELKNKLKFVIETIKKQDRYSDFKNAFYEEKIYIQKDYSIPVTFMGIIDKLKYYEENGKTYVAVIDYKTGTPNTNLNNTIYGLEMQLPVYLYLAKNFNKLQNVEVTGFYLQKILNKEINYDPTKSYEDRKQNQLKLEGFSTSEESVLEHFDHTYQNSEMIKSLKLSKNGFYSYSNVLDPIRMDRLVNLTERKIEEAITKILNAEFKVNPKRINGENKGCEYCAFKDLCYLQEKNYVDLEEYKNLEFLGGEENGE